MKAQYSEEYYRKNWERFIKRVPGNHYINLEEDLAERMKIYAGCDFPESALEGIRAVEAARIADACMILVKKDMATIKSLQSGEAGLGYTTKVQEIQAMGELVQRFEFNCLQLADFKKKYGLTA